MNILFLLNLFSTNFGILIILVSVHGTCLQQSLLYCWVVIICFLFFYTYSLGFLCKETLSFLPFYLYVSVWTYILIFLFCGLWLNTVIINSAARIVLALATGPRSGWLLCLLNVPPFFLSTSLFSDTTRCSSLVFSLPQPWKQPLLQGVLIPFLRRRVFRAKREPWTLGVLTATVKCPCS